jgi:hypothetical protein
MTAFGGQFPCPLGMRNSELQSRAHQPTKTFLHGFQVQVCILPQQCVEIISEFKSLKIWLSLAPNLFLPFGVEDH